MVFYTEQIDFALQLHTPFELLKTVKSVLKFPGKLQYTAVMLGCITVYSTQVCKTESLQQVALACF